VKGRTTPGRSTQNSRNSEQDFGLIVCHGSPPSAGHSFISRAPARVRLPVHESGPIGDLKYRSASLGTIRARTCNRRERRLINAIILASRFALNAREFIFRERARQRERRKSSAFDHIGVIRELLLAISRNTIKATRAHVEGPLFTQNGNSLAHATGQGSIEVKRV